MTPSERYKAWYAKNKEKRDAYVKQWRAAHPDYMRKKWRDWREKDPTTYNTMRREYEKERRQIIKKEVMSHYCAGVPKCACCGESGLFFLSVDHIEGKGNIHRKSIGINPGAQFYAWLKRNGYPTGYQVLCFNCNMAKSRLANCPHKTQIKT